MACASYSMVSTAFSWPELTTAAQHSQTHQPTNVYLCIIHIHAYIYINIQNITNEPKGILPVYFCEAALPALHIKLRG